MLSYMFSHQATTPPGAMPSSWGPNQVLWQVAGRGQLLFPEAVLAPLNHAGCRCMSGMPTMQSLPSMAQHNTGAWGSPPLWAPYALPYPSNSSLLPSNPLVAPHCAFLRAQVHVYMPQVSHPNFGILRTIVKDSNDYDTGPPSVVYMDSGGGRREGGPAAAHPLQCCTAVQDHHSAHSCAAVWAIMGSCRASCKTVPACRS